MDARLFLFAKYAADHLLSRHKQQFSSNYLQTRSINA